MLMVNVVKLLANAHCSELLLSWLLALQGLPSPNLSMTRQMKGNIHPRGVSQNPPSAVAGVHSERLVDCHLLMWMVIHAAASGNSSVTRWDVPSIEVTADRGASPSCSGFLQRRALGRPSGLVRTAAPAG